ncbi:fibronectin type III domain-containing protein [Agromyces sp. NPDC056379]|uniref:fibronectin type III domain-containing protein n=1 Tax=unclassified Agromyces TaxID=2639701 RepID=UPI0035DABE07
MLTALAIAGTVVLGGVAAAPATAAPSSPTDTVDYFDDAYEGLGPDSVYETVTFERFEYLLGQEGRFAFLIGGPEDAQTAATAGPINDVAKAAGVERIYNFDPRLDGDRLDIRTTTNADVAPLWARLVANALGKDTQTPFDGTDDPTLFVYDSAHVEGGTEDRIVSAITTPVTAEQLADPAALTAYKAEVAAVLGTAADLDTSDQFTFTEQVVNAKHASAYGGRDVYGGATVLDDADADWRVQTVTYPELVNLLESDGDYVLLFGGTWCHNTRAVLKEVNRQAVANDVAKVYFFDLRLDGNSGNDLHIRDTGSEFADFYGDLVATYLPNLVTQYVPGVSGQVDYFPGGDTSTALATAKKLQVPYLLEYDRSRTLGGQPAPIAQQWIHSNGDGTYKEYMTEWWYVNDLPGRYADRPDPAGLAAQLAFADEAIAALGTFFDALPYDPEVVATAPDAPAAPVSTVAGTGVTVSWTAPADGGSPITEYLVSLNGGAPVSVPAGTTTRTFTGLAAGEYTATVAARNTVGTSAASAASAAVTVTAAPAVDPTTVKGSVAVTGDLVPGGRITVVGTSLAPGTGGFAVELHSTPQTLGSATTNGDGGFTFTGTIPAATPAGAHSIVVTIDGVEVASASITVAAGSGAGSASAGLASTGTAFVDVLGWLAFALIAAGGAAYAIVRVRTRRVS